MRYTAAKTNVVDPEINSAEWKKADTGYIDANRWTECEPSPATTFKLLRGPEGLSILMHTAEKELRSECNEENGAICTDSCMEFFFKPDIHDTRYFNFEINPKGVLHLGFGSGRHGRELIDIDRNVFHIVSCAKDGDWTLKFYIPDSFLLKYVKKISPVCKGNFYKCGDLTGHTHYGAWSEVENDIPDFHVPDFFGIIEL